ncbi:hypothetical protein T492DRAFT_926802 [Pavlovales sp. CCMP2436]|nr:hypothetical protein T492DRAFT_926802 [Pavlovales sp. CCMP2436]
MGTTAQTMLKLGTSLLHTDVGAEFAESWASPMSTTSRLAAFATLANLALPSLHSSAHDERDLILTLARRRRLSLKTPRAPALRPLASFSTLDALAEMEPLTLGPAFLAPAEPACFALGAPSTPALRPTLGKTHEEMDSLSLPISLSDSEADAGDAFEEERDLVITLARRRRHSLTMPRAPALRPLALLNTLDALAEMEVLSLEPACLTLCRVELERGSLLAPRPRPTLGKTLDLEMEEIKLPISLSDLSRLSRLSDLSENSLDMRL